MGKLDTTLNKWVSRKLMVFFIATMLRLFDKIESSHWAYIGLAYVVMVGVADAKLVIEKFLK